MPVGANVQLIIDYTLAESLLADQFNLERQGAQQLVLVNKDEAAGISSCKRVDNEVFLILTGQDPAFLYVKEAKWWCLGEVSWLGEASDVSHQTKRVLKVSSRLSEHEIKILRQLKESDRLVGLVEVLDFDGVFTHVYVHAVPVCEFLAFKHKYSEESVVKVLRQMLDAVQWLHIHGYMHLNIHPLSVFNSGLTQVDVKLGGMENTAVLEDELSRTAGFKQMLLSSLPLEFAGNFCLNLLQKSKHSIF